MNSIWEYLSKITCYLHHYNIQYSLHPPCHNCHSHNWIQNQNQSQSRSHLHRHHNQQDNHHECHCLHQILNLLLSQIHLHTHSNHSRIHHYHNLLVLVSIINKLALRNSIANNLKNCKIFNLCKIMKTTRAIDSHCQRQCWKQSRRWTKQLTHALTFVTDHLIKWSITLLLWCQMTTILEDKSLMVKKK